MSAVGVILWSALALPAASVAAAPEDLQTQAEQAFAEGVQLAAKQPNEARACFGCAALLYERLLHEGAANPDLYRNLGQAYLLAREPDQAEGDQLAQAIFAFRRGLRLAPTDRRLQEGLAFARQQVIYPSGSKFGQPFVEHRPPWLPRWPGVLLGLALTAYTLLCFSLARWWMVRRTGLLTSAGVLAVVALLCLTAGSLEAWQIRQEDQRPFVVIAQDGVQLLSGNGSRYPPRYETPLHRGAEARLRFERGRWVQIELSGGEIGWVPRTAVLVDQ